MKLGLKHRLFGKATADEWIDWIDSELTPPYVGNAKDPTIRYVLTSFKESLLLLKDVESKEKK